MSPLRPLASRIAAANFQKLVRRPETDPALEAAVAALREELAVARQEAAAATARADFAVEVAREMSLPTKMLAFMSWLDLHPPDQEGPLISVILATRNRPRLLSRAIASVAAQTYRNWELLVVDDGTDPGTRAVAEAAEDERVRVFEGPQRSLGAARNTGLDGARGELVCYLDDDNVMHPSWLHAVAKVFSERVDADVGYGITLSEHRIPGDLGEWGWWPSFWQLPWSREEILRENVTDAGAVAHRRDLDGARYDEELTSGEDWDLLLRLTTERDALRIPALSHAYAMHAENRMSEDESHRRVLDEIRRRHGG